MLLSAERETKKPNHKPVSVKSSVKSTLKSIYRDRHNEYKLFDGENSKGIDRLSSSNFHFLLFRPFGKRYRKSKKMESVKD